MDDALLAKTIDNCLRDWHLYKSASTKREKQVLSNVLSGLLIQAMLPRDKRMSLKRLLVIAQKDVYK